jgi:hypothetical protein
MHRIPSVTHFIMTNAATLLLVLAISPFAAAQQVPLRARSARLPSAERVVGEYIKAIGGKKRVAAVKDASYEWAVHKEGASSGTAQIEMLASSSVRMSLQIDGVQSHFGVSGSSVWEQTAEGVIRTATDMTANESRLQAILLASRFVNYGKINVLARVTGIENSSTGPQYVVQFSARNGARVRTWFSTSTKLLTRMVEEFSNRTAEFSDYQNNDGILEPYRVSIEAKDTGPFSMTLQRVVYNKGLTLAAFDPPARGNTVDIAALLKDLQANQGKIDERVAEYYYTQKETEREINDKGELKKETVKIYEVFPVPGRGSVLKLVSENGTPLSQERAEKEQKRVGEELEKAERERLKEKEKRERQSKETVNNKKDEDREPGILTFLRVCDFVSPRAERLGNREAVVFDFRGKPGFRPSNRQESLVSKLVGSAWIDPIDKVVIRIEAKFAEGFKVGGGLLLSLKPGAAFVLEQTRLEDGVWLPKFAQANLSYKLLLLAGGTVNKTSEWSDYHRIKTETGDYKLDAPATANPTKP